MNEIVNKFFLAGDKLMSDMHLSQTGFIYCAFVVQFKTLYGLNTIPLMDILKIYLEEHLLIKSYVIKRLILQKNQNVMDINVDCFTDLQIF